MPSFSVRFQNLTSRHFFSAPFVRLLGKAVLALAIFHAAFQLCYWLPMQMRQIDLSDDTKIYYDAAVRWRLGQPIYQPWPDFSPQMMLSRFFYPPSFLPLIAPLAGLSLLGFTRVWCALLILAFWIYAACLAQLATGKIGWKSVVIAGLCIDLCPRGYAAMAFGNFEPVMWACYGLAFATRVRSVPLAFGMLMKLHPIWTLLLVVKNEGKTALWPALAVITLGTAAGVWTSGWHNSLMWWPSVSNVLSQGTFVDGNVSLSFAGLRLLKWLGWNYTGGSLPTWARLYLSAMALIAPAVAIALTRKLPKDLSYALVASATILFAPLCWALYLPLLLSPLAITYRLKTKKMAEFFPEAI